MPPIAISTVTTAREIGRAAWERLAPPGHPFLNADFLDILERHETAGPACGWQANHLIAKDRDGMVVGILPSYLKRNSHGDFIRDWSWAAAYEQLGKIYFPKLLSGLPHTPARGPRLLVGSGNDADGLRTSLIEAARHRVSANGLSSWHVALPADSDVDLLVSQSLLVSHDVQFHWRNRGFGDFDEFLGAFASARRRKVKAERRRIIDSGLRIEVRHGDEIDPAEWPALHQLYATTFDKFGNYAAFSPSCFAELAATLGRRMVVFIAREQATPVAISICFRSNDTLYGRYWGTQGNYHSLHFELCFYQGIAYCLEHGLSTFEPGAGGEHKVARGFEPTLVRSCHWIEDERMRHLIGQHLARQKSAVLAYAEEAASHLPYRTEP
ncbi:GNAT family N-acetyltransferase [Dechloromonas denitrificans]|uniref:GNAT family N-acetyltransferase n=1 Tax=Dechloromonas denitrificans TaxID=281362 RepID=UPI001CFB4B3C|nr:GNAT family N-acetyltransferase [Dechloromonas denitrificans]UCV06146.1 GNAT family N-acetyltransferase [Dechloromonas denitrificans]